MILYVPYSLYTGEIDLRLRLFRMGNPMENRTEARRRKSESIQTAAFKIKNIVKETSIDIPDNACSLSGAENCSECIKISTHIP
ncbi:hypothetical protein [Allobaculum sp. Allo2]|uniref:hypothetical protein n=1 Tax=Allobaculum sp. Allo2 TaxID=2853432 RepID=UPI001F613006|nr:hypothetical protein [Allobaculum sp. Allo2]UNT93550.1 hypothetical protein KWG61_01785 [Allobaculum sp. Allo2]